MISQYVIPGIVRLLQNSAELKKLTTMYTIDDIDIILVYFIFSIKPFYFSFFLNFFPIFLDNLNFGFVESDVLTKGLHDPTHFLFYRGRILTRTWICIA